METNVTGLLREFPKVRRAALAGETVIVKTRDGDLRITRDEDDKESSLPDLSKKGAVLGCMKGSFTYIADDIDQPTLREDEWNTSL